MSNIFQFEIEPPDAGQRLDRFLALAVPALSRSAIQRLIRDGDVTVDGELTVPKLRIQTGQRVSLRVPPPRAAAPEPQQMDLVFLYRDEHLVVIDKPAGLTVHPAPGQGDRTLVNGLLFEGIGLSGIGGVQRPGIVHRLDRETSGVMVVACHDEAHRHLSKAFALREVEKTYLCVTAGKPRQPEGLIDTPYGRDPNHRLRFSGKVRSDRRARTRYRVLETFGPCALVEIDLLTGRTHQIRVHLSEAGTPLVGDELYGGANRWKGVSWAPAKEAMRAMTRQALHASRLAFTHPITKEAMVFESPLPADFQGLIQALRA